MEPVTKKEMLELILHQILTIEELTLDPDSILNRRLEVFKAIFLKLRMEEKE
jgi:hypothetical protein